MSMETEWIVMIVLISNKIHRIDRLVTMYLLATSKGKKKARNGYRLMCDLFDVQTDVRKEDALCLGTDVFATNGC